ncbi:MAG: hypothetical protein ACJ8GO_17040 [Ramlibacter sp.]
MTRANAQESRRQVLVATIALQRFALRSDIGVVRRSLAARIWWPPAAALASAALAGSSLLSGHDTARTLRLLRLVRFAARCGSLAVAAIRLARR